MPQVRLVGRIYRQQVLELRNCFPANALGKLFNVSADCPLHMRNILLITDERGKRYLAVPSGEMVNVKGLGTVRSDSLMKSLETGELSIGGKTLKVRHASVEDIISTIERKAQMLTPKDIAMIIHLCGIGSGSKVVEGGAGSGALSIALLATIGTEGNLTTYELREDFATIARKNIESASLSEGWTLKIGNVCENIDEHNVDAVVLDIPNPWDCVSVAKAALKSGGTFCAFIPNVNQVVSTVHSLRDNSFADVRAIETLQRELLVHEGGARPSCDMLGHTGYLVVARR